MSRVLLVLGSMLAMLLTAALILPVFVNWNGYRPLVEARLETLLGREVAIEGDLDIAILPRLRLEAAEIAVGPQDAPLVTIASAEIVASLVAPLSPDLPIQSLTLRGLDAALRFGPDGTLVLGDAEGTDEADDATGGDIDPDTVSIDTIVLDGARLSLATEAGSAPLLLEDVDATGRAGRLTGPWDLEGVLASAGQRFGWRINTGEARGSQLRIKARLEPLRPATQRADVAVVDATLAWGQASATEGPVSLDGQASLTSTPARAADDTGLLGRLPWRAEARLRLDPSRLLLQDLALRLGPEEIAANLTGTASYAFGAARANMVLSARQVDLDRLFGDGPQGAIVPATLARAILDEMADRDAPLRTADAAPPPDPIRVDLGLDVDGVVAGGEVVRDVALEARTMSDGRVRIAGLSARLPGRTALRLAGTGQLGRPETRAERVGVNDANQDAQQGAQQGASPRNAPGPTFLGTIALDGARPDVLLDWITGAQDEAGALPTLAEPINLSGQLEASPGAILLDEAELDLGAGGALTGTLALGLNGAAENQRWAARLSGEALRLDRLTTAPLADLRRAVSRPFELDLDIEQVDLGRVSADGVRVTARYDGSTLDLDTFALADLGGARVSASGTLETGGADGAITIDLDAERLDGVLALGRALEAPPSLMAGLEARAGALVPAALQGAIAATRDEAGARTSLRLEGDVGGTRTVLRVQRLSAPGEDVRIAGFLDADAPDSETLIAQLGLPLDLWPGPGAARAGLDLSAIDIAYEGTLEGGTVEGALDALGAHLDFVGTVARGAETESDTEGLADAALDFALGLDVNDAARLAAALPGTVGIDEDGPSIRGEARLRRDPDAIGLTDIALTIDDVALSGDVTVETRERRREVDGSIDLSRLSLGWLGAALLGTPDGVGSDDDGAPASTRTFAPALLSAWGADDVPVGGGVDVEVAALSLTEDGGDEGRARFRLSWPRGGVRLGDIDARLLAGRVTGRALLTREGEGPQTDLSLDLALQGARLGAGEANAPLRGDVDARVSLEGSGRSPAALLASLSGDGSVLGRNLLLRDLAPIAFARTIEALQGQESLIEEIVAETFRESLLGGLVEIDALEAALSIEDGVVRVPSLVAEADALSLRARAAYDLAAAALDLDLTLTPNAETPDLGNPTARAVLDAAPSVGFSLSADAPGEIAIDASALTNAIAVVGFEAEIERLRAVEEEILERARLGRELVRQGEARRRAAGEDTEEEGGASTFERTDAVSTIERADEDAEEAAPVPQAAAPETAAPETAAPATPPARAEPAPVTRRANAAPAAPSPSQRDRIGDVLRDVLR
ncbi:MAG: AsmA-like C-terminal region-containing protein [Pseudomonadota bacterium]